MLLQRLIFNERWWMQWVSERAAEGNHGRQIGTPLTLEPHGYPCTVVWNCTGELEFTVVYHHQEQGNEQA